MTTKRKVLYAISAILLVMALLVSTIPGIAYAAYDNVTLGTDRTFSSGWDYGLNGAGKSGGPLGCWNSGYFYSTGRAEAVVFLALPGFGSANAWARIGKCFRISGSGSRSANIRVAGYYDGYVEATGGASCGVTVDVVLLDQTTGASTRTNVLSESQSGIGIKALTHSYNCNLPVLLQAGHSYAAYAEVRTSGSYFVVGTCSSDFGTQDKDPGYTRISSIMIDF